MEKYTDLISIIIPVYNVEKYIDRCLSSVINQIYKNIEIIVVNDGSTDNSENICKKYAEEDKRIVLTNQSNKGLSAARNAGLEAAKGKYVMFVDSDDYVEENYVFHPYHKLIETDSDIVEFNYRVCYKNGEKEILINDHEFTVYGIDILRYNLQGRISDRSWNKLYKKELFNEIKFPEGEIYEEVGTTFLLLKQARSYAFIPDVFYNYRSRNGSIAHDDEKYLNEQLYQQVKNKYEFLRDLNGIEKDLDVYYFYSLLEYCNKVCILSDEKDKVKQLCNEIIKLSKTYNPKLSFKQIVCIMAMKTNVYLYRFINIMYAKIKYYTTNKRYIRYD